MISLSNVKVSFGGFELFRSVSFLINKKDKIGLVGRNGAGKSTLLKIILGKQGIDTGTVSRPSDIKLGYLPQQMPIADRHTIIEETSLAFAELKELEKTIKSLNSKIGEQTDYESDEYFRLIDDLAHTTERFEMLGGSNTEALVDQTLTGLGFRQEQFNDHTGTLSGGWRMRIELAKVLLQKPDVLLLDEPTNHLDIESIQWFEEFLTNYQGAVLLISHDRAFLDNVTTRTIEISLGNMYDYKVPYSKYLELRAERRQQQLSAYNNQQKMIKDTERFIERFRYKNTKSVQVQSRIKQLDKLERLEVDEEDTASLNFRFPPATHSGTIVVECDELSMSYGQKNVLDKVELIIERGEKVAFVGKNGEGKTTMSRIIIGELKAQGEIKLGHKVEIAYYAQDQDKLLDENKTVLQTIDDIAVGDIRTRIRDILGSFLFSGEDVDKKVKVLSGGERSRLALAKLLLKPANLLVLDEPTNHLDIPAKDILKKALLKYDGTMILVSHDRYFLDGLVSKVFEFKNKKIKENIGGIYDFLRKKKIENLNELNKKQKAEAENKKENVSQNKLNYEERKELEREIRKTSNKLKSVETKIEKLEKEIARFDTVLQNPDDSELDLNDTTIFMDYETLKKELETEMKNWEEISYELEILTEKRE